MALNKEIWLNDIIEGFWPSNSFVQKSLDHSEHVNDKTVHVPQAGAAPTVTKDRSSFPASITERTDTDFTYSLHTFDTPPIVTRDLELVELSYDKRQSLLKQSKEALQQAVIIDVLKSWVPSSAPVAVATSGDTVAAHAPSATGNRKALTRADIQAIKKRFDVDDVPAEGRCLLLDAEMYDQLLNEMTDAENNHFLACADPATGVIGKYMGFDIYMRSTALVATAGGALKTGSASATDTAAGLAWHKNCVSRALGGVEIFESKKDPTYYGDIFSIAMRAGGSYMRSDKKGVILLYQATPSAS